MNQNDSKPFRQHGTTGSVVKLALANLLLNIVTLSLWRFWARTRVRRLLWANTTAWGDPLEYTGTGKEVFIGFLIILVVVFLPLTLAFTGVQVLATTFPPAALLFLPLQLAVMVLIGAGLYRARRYQLSRTVWRGIRGGLDGSALRYGLLWTLVTVVSILTLGWAWPWGEMKLARYRLGNTSFGSVPFVCDADAKGLYGAFAGFWFGTLIVAMIAGATANTLGPAINPVLIGLAINVVVAITGAHLYSNYKAKQLARLASHTRYGGMPFSLNVTAGSLFGLVFGNWLITALSLGVLQPWAALRTFRFACGAIQAHGEIDFAAIGQSTAERPERGEGLVAVLDGAGDF